MVAKANQAILAGNLSFAQLRRLTFLLFFLSGASALTYEVTWVRELSLSFGVSVYAVTAVLTAFMGGLALGSWLWGRIVIRRAPLRLYAALQLGAGLSALVTPFAFGWLTTLYVDIYNAWLPNPLLFNLIRFVLASLVLLIPATLMGGSFPVISQFLARRPEWRGGDLGFLYAANTLGGVIGTVLTGLVLIRFLGAHATINLAAGIDIVVAAVAMIASRRYGFDPLPAGDLADEVPAPTVQPEIEERPVPKKRTSRKAARRTVQTPVPAIEDPRQRRFEMRVALWGFALSGFVSLGYEVVWTRLLAIFTLNTVYSFTIMLTIFLLGLALGSFLVVDIVDSLRRPLAFFGFLQMLIGLTSVVMLFVFAKLPTILATLTNVVSYRQEVLAEFIAGGITMLVPTLLIGATFPVAARIYAGALGNVGARMGRLYSLNTIGAMLGSFITGFGLIPLLGLQHAALLLAGLNLALGAVAVMFVPRRASWPALGIIAAAVLAAFLLPPGIYLGFREGAIPQLIFYREGVDATVSVFQVDNPPLKVSFVNGRSEVPTDRDSMRAFYLLGHLPPLLHPNAKSALMVSFGNGIATGAMARHKIPRIQAVEIVAEQKEAARLYKQENRDVLDYPGLNITIEDGRNYLLRSREQFDIITADATHPVNTSSWALFTREFYSLVQQRLTKDGVFVQWLPFHDLSQSDYRDIIKTFQSVFPHTTLWFTGGTHTFLVATPNTLTRADIVALEPRIKQLGIADDIQSAQRLSEDLLLDEDAVRQYTADARIVTDDRAFFVPSPDMEQILQSFVPYMKGGSK